MGESTGPSAEEIKKPAAPAKKKKQPKKLEPINRVIIRSYPKIVFLYPMFIMAAIAGLVQAFMDQPSTVLTWVFLVVTFFNLLVVAFEFSRNITVSVVLFLALAIVVGILLNDNFGFVEPLKDMVAWFEFQANAQFYGAFAFLFFLIYVGVYIDTRFDYWEIKPNEILHHHGFLGDVQRYPAPNLQMKKEINDVFEYFLLLSGRLILRPSGSSREVTLENVLRINHIEYQVQRLLESIQVKVDIDKG